MSESLDNNGQGAFIEDSIKKGRVVTLTVIDPSGNEKNLETLRNELKQFAAIRMNCLCFEPSGAVTLTLTVGALLQDQQLPVLELLRNKNLKPVPES